MRLLLRNSPDTDGNLSPSYTLGVVLAVLLPILGLLSLFLCVCCVRGKGYASTSIKSATSSSSSNHEQAPTQPPFRLDPGQPERPLVQHELDRPLGRDQPGRPLGREEPGRPLGRDEPGRPLGRVEYGRPLGRDELGRPLGRDDEGHGVAMQQGGDRPLQRFVGGDRPLERPARQQPHHGGDRPLQRPSGSNNSLRPRGGELRVKRQAWTRPRKGKRKTQTKRSNGEDFA